MTVSLFIEYNFAPIVGLIFQVIIFLFSKDYNKHDKKVLYFAFIFKNLFEEIKKIEFSFDDEYKIDISIGLAAYSGENDICFDDLYKEADNNLYTAKTFEGDCVI